MFFWRKFALVNSSTALSKICNIHCTDDCDFVCYEAHHLRDYD